LAEDPQAQLPAPHQGDIEIVELEPRTIKPLEDYSRFINRGEPEAAEPEPFVPALSDPMPGDPVPGPVFGPMPDETLPPWLDSAGSGFRPPLIGH